MHGCMRQLSLKIWAGVTYKNVYIYQTKYVIYDGHQCLKYEIIFKKKTGLINFPYIL